MAKQVIKNYSFNAGAKTVTLSDFGTVLLERLALVTDTTTNQILYNFADSSVAAASVAGNVITLSTLPGGVANTDKLRIDYEDLTGDPTYDTSPLASNAAQETGGNLAAIKADVDKIPAKGAATTANSLPVTIASDQTVPVSGSLSIAANSSVNVNQVAGTAVDTNSGAKSAGTQRVVLATDQPQLANALKVDGSAVTQPVSGTVTTTPSGTQTVSGTVTANAGTNLNTSALALDATLTGGSQKTKLVDSGGTNVATVSAGGALKVDGSGATQPVSGTVSATQSGSWTVQPGNTANTTAWKVDGSAVTQPVSGTVTSKLQDGSGNAIGSTGGSLNVSVTGSSSSSTTVDEAAWTAGSSSFTPGGGVFNDAAAALTTGQQGTQRLTPNRGGHVNLRNNAGTELATSGNPLRTDPTGTTTQPVSGTVTITPSGTQTISGTVTANAGTNLNTSALALDATLTGGTQKTKLVDSGGTNTASIDSTGALAIQSGGSTGSTVPVRAVQVAGSDGTNLRALKVSATGVVSVDGSAVTQPISGTVTTTPSGTQTVSGTVTANAGTNLNTSALALDTTIAATQVAQASTTSGQKGSLIQGAVTTTAPSYTAAQTSPISLTTAGAIRTDSSGTSQPIAHSDTTPATQNVTAQDTSSSTTTGNNSQSIITGTPTANSVAVFALSGIEAVKVQVSGTWTGTLQSEISLDGGTTWYVSGLHQTGTAYTVSTFTANFAGGLNVSGCTNYRLRATAAWTGTATIKVVETINPNSIYVANGLSLQDATTQSQKLVISASGAAKVDGSAVTQPVSGTVSITTNSAVNTAQVAGTTTSVNNGTTDAGTQRVTLSSDSTGQVKLATGANTIGALTANQSVNNAQISGTAVDVNSGNKSAGTQRMVIATDQPNLTTALNVAATQTGTWTVQPGNTANTTAWLVQNTVATSGGATPYHFLSAATTNATNVKNAAGMVYTVVVTNTNTSERFFKFFDKASAPTVGTDTPVWTLQIPGNTSGAGMVISLPVGLKFTNGISFAITGAGADNDATAISANDVIVNLGYA